MLGTVVSPYSGETLATIETPFAESWIMMARCRVSRVHPGDPLYIIGRATERILSEWHVSNPEVTRCRSFTQTF